MPADVYDKSKDGMPCLPCEWKIVAHKRTCMDTSEMWVHACLISRRRKADFAAEGAMHLDSMLNTMLMKIKPKVFYDAKRPSICPQ